MADGDDDNGAALDLPPGLVTPTLAGIYLQQGHTAQALAIYRKLAERAPDDPDLRRIIATLEQRVVDERSRETKVEHIDELKRLLRRIQRRRKDRRKTDATSGGTP